MATNPAGSAASAAAGAGLASGMKGRSVADLNLASPRSGGWARQVPGNGFIGKRRFFVAMDRKWVHLSYMLIDVVLVFINGLVAFYTRFMSLSLSQTVPARDVGLSWDLRHDPYGAFLLLYVVLIVLFCQSQDLYRTPRGRTAGEEGWAVLRAVTFATVILGAFIFCSNVTIVSREVIGLTAFLNVTTLIVWRAWKRRLVKGRIAQGIGALNTVIIGAGEVGRALAQYFEENKELGYRVVGFLDDDHCKQGRLLGKIEDLPRVARTQFVDEVFVTAPSERESVKSIAAIARNQRLNVTVVPELYDGLAWNAPFHQMGGFPMMELHWEPIPTLHLFFKRLIDITLSGITLTIFSPLFLLLAVAIKLESSGPALYTSKRVGKKGSTFTCYKFRTMVINAEELRSQLHHLNERSNGLLFKIANDPRVTRLGRFLRCYSLDELPQLWNVFRGEMSLVGPRPPLPSEFDQYSLEHFQRLDIRPGITGLWQVKARRDPSFESYMALDLEYIKNWSLWLDMKILLRTIPAVLRADGY